eukprot:Seg92.3 transcript_id=Seg92.3/GoldUCD/mRNA.D3Y31 product="Rieske domain-containing protein" protein_id=Seg92.3/GoldUCD/D3Y31
MSPPTTDLQARKGQANAKLQIAYDEGLNGGFAEETLQSGMASLSVVGKDKNEVEEDRRDQRDDDDYMFFRIDGLNFNDLYDFRSNPVDSKSQRFMRRLSAIETKMKSGHLIHQNCKEIALFRYGEGVYAIDERCPHVGGPLHLGDIETVGEANILCVVCPWHRWKIELKTGKLKVPLRPKQVTVYPVKISDMGDICIGFDEFSPSYFEAKDDF